MTRREGSLAHRVPRVLLIAAVLTGTPSCASTVQTIQPGIGATMTVDDFLSTLVLETLRADVRGETPMGWYAGDAFVVANGVERRGPPRFAGTATSGEIAITASRTKLTGTGAWAYVEYQWISLGEGLVREGRATLVLTRHDGPNGWQITHVNSTSPTP